MPLKSISIANYRGISTQQRISFAIPDAKTTGSGLTVIVGPNNAGKSTLLRAINEIYSSGADFVAEVEDRHGNQYPTIRADFQLAGENKFITTTPNEKSAYMRKVGDVQAAANSCRYIPARRPWRDRFSRNVGYALDNYLNDTERSRRSDDYFVDSQFGSMLHGIEQDPNAKQKFISILKYIEPTISNFWIDRAHGQDYLAFESVSGASHRVGLVGEGILNLFRLCYGIIYLKKMKRCLLMSLSCHCTPKARSACSGSLRSEPLIDRSSSALIRFTS